MAMDKGIIYYTDNRIQNPIRDTVRKLIKASRLPVVSTSLRPIFFGKNIIVEGSRSYPTMVKQILTALENTDTEYVFFCEHDVLYPKDHFDFTPEHDDVFYYNSNVWRWRFGSPNAIRYDGMLPLSCMCANRDFALAHYRLRMQRVIEWGLDEFRSREPRKGRIWGYEPGRKPTRRGGFSDDKYGVWQSQSPVIDIRHQRTFSSPKIRLDEFIHKPKKWEEIPYTAIPGWDLKSMFQL